MAKGLQSRVNTQLHICTTLPHMAEVAYFHDVEHNIDEDRGARQSRRAGRRGSSGDGPKM